MRGASALLFAALSGCIFNNNQQHVASTYCDETGCYACDAKGCQKVGSGTRGSCRVTADCTIGCYCEAKSGQCIEAGFCKTNDDCKGGLVCDIPRTSCQPPTSTTGCTDDKSCPTGQFCNKGQCTSSWQCQKDADCGTGMKCDERHTCVPGPVLCQKDNDCAVGSTCQNGTCRSTGSCKSDSDCTPYGTNLICDPTRQTCVPKPSQMAQCHGNSECASGQVCSNASCANDGHDPTRTCVFNRECGTGECQNGLCHAKCAQASDCGTGDLCQTGYCFANPASNGKCTFNSDCANGAACENGACHAACKKDGDCASKTDFCNAGFCRPDWRKKAECATNGQCTSGECVNGECRTHCQKAADCGSCGNARTICSGGYCTSQAELSPRCKLKSDCAASQNCTNGACL